MSKNYWSLACLLLVSCCMQAQSFNELVLNNWGGSFPSDLVVFNGKLYFSASDSTHGFEPWVSDETTSGTKLLKDIFVGTGNSFPQNLTVDSTAGLLFFQADDSVHGAELWLSNGDSTWLLKDIYPGQSPSLPQNMFMFNGKLYFQADDGAHGPELWVSDGTANGTQLLKDINTAHNDTAGSFPSGFTTYNGKLYFNAADSAHGYELWVTDGTTAGTNLVADIYPDTLSSNPTDLTVFNGKLYFAATDSVHGNELWVTDGINTTLAFDFNQGYQSSNPQGLTVINSKLVLQADDGTDGPELWSVDANGVGAQLVYDIYPGPTGSYPQGFTPYEGKLYFQATDSLHGTELWSTDGTNAGTSLVADIVAGPNSSNPAYFINYHNKLYFIAQPDTVSGDQLFVTDGTGAGTQGFLLTDVALNPLGATNGFTLFNNSLAFSAFYDAGQQLWFFDDAPTAVNVVAGNQTFGVYPNPCVNNYTLSGISTGQNYTISLTDLEGRVLQTQQLQAYGQRMSFVLPQVSAGLYLVQVQSGNEVSTLRLVKGE